MRVSSIKKLSLAWLIALATMVAMVIPMVSATPAQALAVPVGATLDCDDESGNTGDPEVDDRADNLSGETETYTCTVTAPDGDDEGTDPDPVPDAVLDAEHQGPNDPDNRGYANVSNLTADYDNACTTGANGACTFLVEQNDGEFGDDAFVCFWVDDDADSAYLDGGDVFDGGQCDSDESNGEPENNDLTDKVNISWVAQAADLDASPETATSQSGTSHTVTALVINEAGDPAADELVDFEVEGGPNDGVVCNDVTTAADGTTSCTYDDARDPTTGGDDTIRVYVTGQKDGAEVPAEEDVDLTDVVTKTWTAEAPVTQCDDDVDNDGDGRTDFGDDPGCDSPEDDDETDGCDINGTSEGDVLTGTPAGEVICGRGGDDTITGEAGDDIVLGGPGDDIIAGGGGNDTMSGSSGADSIRGGSDDDDIRGGSGADDIRGGSGLDLVSAGGGRDQVTGGSGADLLDGEDGKDVLSGDGGADTLRGGSGNDTLRGGKGPDTLKGGSDNDVLRGGGSRDSLKGGRGDDFLDGGPGADTCSGGPGNDSRRRCE